MTGAEVVVAAIIGLVALGLYLCDVGDDPAPQYSRLDRLDGLGEKTVSELPPPRVRGQRQGTCKTCTAKGRTGAIRYYPRPGLAENSAGAETVGQWAHVDRRDWLDDPHEPEPDEG